MITKTECDLIVKRYDILMKNRGKFVRHFKGKFYTVIDVAEHTETGEVMVVYKANYGTDADAVYVRPLTMFLSEVDKQKYPDAQQQYRFIFEEEV